MAFPPNILFCCIVDHIVASFNTRWARDRHGLRATARRAATLTVGDHCGGDQMRRAALERGNHAT
jgi:hypothetical protein